MVPARRLDTRPFLRHRAESDVISGPGNRSGLLADNFIVPASLEDGNACPVISRELLMCARKTLTDMINEVNDLSYVSI